MVTSSATPLFEGLFPDLNNFILRLVDLYNRGNLKSWDELDETVKSYFTPKRIDETESMLPGWKKMMSYTDGITCTHILCAFLGLFMLPEYQVLTREEQNISKWIVLFHDIAKIHIRGKRDSTHAFRSAVITAGILPRLDFPTTDEYKQAIKPWSELTNTAVTESQVMPGDQISDNRKLVEIMPGIEKMYGAESPAATILKGVLLHMSIETLKDWPQPAPLTDDEIDRYVTKELLPFLKVMHLADNEGWNLFQQEREIYRTDTLAAFERVSVLITDEY